MKHLKARMKWKWWWNFTCVLPNNVSKLWNLLYRVLVPMRKCHGLLVLFQTTVYLKPLEYAKRILIYLKFSVARFLSIKTWNYWFLFGFRQEEWGEQCQLIKHFFPNSVRSCVHFYFIFFSCFCFCFFVSLVHLVFLYQLLKHIKLLATRVRIYIKLFFEICLWHFEQESQVLKVSVTWTLSAVIIVTVFVVKFCCKSDSPCVWCRNWQDKLVWFYWAFFPL